MGDYELYPMTTLHVFDWVIIITYFLFILWIGIFRFKEQAKTQNAFILSGRKLSLVGFIATLVTTWYGGILGVGENTLLYGIQTWFIFALPYYFFAIIYLAYTFYGIKKQNDGIGHSAHLGGAIGGIFISLIYEPNILMSSFNTLALMIMVIFFGIVYFKKK